VYKPFQYEENPNLRFDIIENELISLQKTLSTNGVNVSNLRRIECFDISNISGKSATGSMVVFTNGEKDSSSYRRFKIKRFYNNKPNDFAMMQEMLERRFKRTDWEIPSLVVIDGGKGQVSSVKEIFEKLNINIPLIGLAKREETIITSDLKPIRLPIDSMELKLIMRIRDEAHRFAITYHRKLRSKSTFL
jgi:excinuclease ABC subunit C